MQYIDIITVIVFLLATMAFGLFQGRNVKTVRDYALGGRNFNTATLATALIATWISGSAFLTDVSEVYQEGLFYMVPGMLGDIFSWIIICYFIAPRMGEFLGSISIADAMGNLYGPAVRFITSIASTFNCVGKIAAQFKVSAAIIQMFFGINSLYATLISSVIIIIYSTFGGIRAVTFTDIIQFFTFGAMVPILALIIWGGFDDPHIVLNTVSENPMFDFTQLINPDHPKFWGALTLALYFIIPSFNPAIFQRVSMAKDTKQVSNSFFVATAARLAISILFFWVGILLLSNNPNVEPDNLFAYMIDNYTYVGFKGFVAAGVLAMVMSTADSYINAASVTFSYDIRKSFGIEWSEKNNLRFSYFCSIFIGFLAFLLAFYMKGMLNLFLMVSSFYLPVVSAPFLLAVFGFRTTPKAVLCGIAGGLITVIVWRFGLKEILGLKSVVPGMLANIICLFAAHYGLRQRGGWVGIKDTSTLQDIRVARLESRKNFFWKIRHFSLIDACIKSTPRSESTYTFFGIFSIVSVFSTMYSMPNEIRAEYSEIVSAIYHTVLVMAAAFLTYPIWPPTFKNRLFISLFWVFGLFYVLVFIGCTQVILSHFGQFQLMIFLLSLVVLSILVSWQIALALIVSGVLASVGFYKWYFAVDSLSGNLGSLQFKIMYIMLLVSSVLVAFFKPKQDYQHATEAKVGVLSKKNTVLTHKIEDYDGKIKIQEKEIARLNDTTRRILNNVNHELRLPVSNVMNFAELLSEGLENYSKDQLKELSEEIHENSNRLSTMILNMLDLALLDSGKIELEKQMVDLSKIVKDRTTHCFNLYKDEKPLTLKLDIESGIFAVVDPNYIRQTIDNLVINAVNYSYKGEIEVAMQLIKDQILFTISDHGMGIPEADIFDIFEPFTVSSKTFKKEEGRGVGLSLCKRAIEAHNGQIRAESDGISGATFKFVLPTEN